MNSYEHRDGFVNYCYWELRAPMITDVAKGKILKTVIIYGNGSDDKNSLFRMIKNSGKFEEVAV